MTATYDPTFHLFPPCDPQWGGRAGGSQLGPICGIPLQTLDATAISTIHSDALCRVSRVDTPLGGFTAWTYLNLGSPTTQHVRSARHPARRGTVPEIIGPWTTWTGLVASHEKRAGGKGASASQTIITDTTYNLLGAADSSTTPRYADGAAYATTYTYDELDRLSRVRFP